MNKNVAILIGVLIVFIVIFGTYSLTKKSPQSLTTQTPVTTEKKSTTQTIQGTLKSLLLAGKSQKCTYSNKLESASINGTVYVANGKIRGDFTSGTEQTKVNGHMIMDSGYAYVWSDMNKQGIKMAIDLKQQLPTGSPANSQTPDINQTFEYKCQEWAEDSTMFILPSTITFSTVALPGTQPSGATPSGTINPAVACSICDKIPAGSGRDVCRTQLHCQ